MPSLSMPPFVRRQLWLAALLVGLALAGSVVAYPRLPAIVATHWDLHGQPDGTSPRLLAVSFMPALMIFVAGLLVVLPSVDFRAFVRYADRSGAAATDTQADGATYALISTIALGAMLGFHLLTLGLGTGWLPAAQGPRAGAIVLSLLFVALGNYMPRVTTRNAFVGVRVPWAYANAEVWRRTQRAGGYSFVAAGLVGLAGAALAPAVAVPTLVVAMIGSIVFVAIYSYRLARTAS